MGFHLGLTLLLTLLVLSAAPTAASALGDIEEYTLDVPTAAPTKATPAPTVVSTPGGFDGYTDVPPAATVVPTRVTTPLPADSLPAPTKATAPATMPAKTEYTVTVPVEPLVPTVIVTPSRQYLPPWTGNVCVALDKGSPGVPLSFPRNYTIQVTKNYDDLLAFCESLADGACSDAFILDGHSSAIEYRYLSCMPGALFGSLTTPDYGPLADCLHRVTGNYSTPFVVSACSGWARDDCRTVLATELNRPLVSAVRGCAYSCSYSSDPYSFGFVEGTWMKFSPNGGAPVPYTGR